MPNTYVYATVLLFGLLVSVVMVYYAMRTVLGVKYRSKRRNLGGVHDD